MFNDFVFGQDVFLQTEYPIALDSNDDWSPEEHKDKFGGFPLSLVADFWDGTEMANGLLKMFPDKKTLLDLGTATGSVPLTMRNTEIKALGLEGLDCKNLDIPNKFLAKPDLYAWKIAPEIVDTCDITYPFQLLDSNGDQIKFDYIISTDCFEHLREERLPALLDNIYNHLKDDGYGIFDINTSGFYDMHQTVKEPVWWKDLFNQRFVVIDDLNQMDFTYIRANVKDGLYTYRHNQEPDIHKTILWVRKVLL